MFFLAHSTGKGVASLTSSLLPNEQATPQKTVFVKNEMCLASVEIVGEHRFPISNRVIVLDIHQFIFIASNFESETNIFTYLYLSSLIYLLFRILMSKRCLGP